jgi:hypothetical protein
MTIQHRMIRWQLNDELERMWEKVVMAFISLEGLRKTIKKKTQDNLCPSQDLNQAPPEHEPRAMPNHSAASFNNLL